MGYLLFRGCDLGCFFVGFSALPSPTKTKDEFNVRNIDLCYFHDTSLAIFLLCGKHSVTSRQSSGASGAALRGIICHRNSASRGIQAEYPFSPKQSLPRISYCDIERYRS